MKERKTLKLKNPITRDDKPVYEIALREPSAGELRGIRLFDLTQGDSDALIKLLPRITTPALTPAEANKLSLRDFARALTAVAEMFALDDEDGEAAGKPSP